MRRIRLLSLVMVGLLLASLTSAGALADGDQPEKTIRIYTNRSESHVAYTLWVNLVERYRAEVNPNFKAEIETVSNLDQYKDKLKLYIAGNNLPDIFQIDKGPIAQELASMGKLVDIDAELQRLGLADMLNEGCRRYVAFDDESLYIFPESRYGNTIFYWKDKFAAAGIEKEPNTFAEFLDVCAKLKANGEVPMAITGKASWNPLHVMYLPSFSVTGNVWINTAKKGETTFAGEPVVWDSVNFLDALVKNGFFPAGFGNIEYTDVMNGFLGGQYAMAWAQSLYIPKMDQLYDEGKIGFMRIPLNDRYREEERLATIAIQCGISWSFNKEKFDTELQRFFDFIMTNYSEESYKLKLFSPFDTELPEGMSTMMKNYYAEMVKQTVCWINWDDACDPVTCQQMDDSVKELAAGLISAEEFVRSLDESVQENGIEYFQ